MKQKKFKVVFDRKHNFYELWFTDHTGEMVLSVRYSTITRFGDSINSEYDEKAFISEDILWEIDRLKDLGYQFTGITRK